MAPTANTNPFEDSDYEEGFTGNPTNPFDHDDDQEQQTPTDLSPSHDDEAGLPPEASWQYLGDLPYRRVLVYENVRWNNSDDGLASFPPSFLKAKRSELLDSRDARELLFSSTVTKVAGCPHGGPIAAITLPVLGGSSMPTTDLRIMTNAGRLLATIEMPPKSLLAYSSRNYTAADIIELGFTERTLLVVVCRDSLTLVYDLKGAPILPPFHILPKGEGKGMEVLQASVFEGGVAVLGTNMQSAIVELLDDYDDPSYANGAHLGARRIHPAFSKRSGDMLAGDSQPPHYVIVTPLPTAAYASENLHSFVAIAVLPRFHTTSRHPDVFLSTSDNSVAVVNTATTEITDVDCRARMASPIVAMSFAPNGRFLACFTKNSILTVISTSFETKVLDFDTSEGSSSPPLDMKWCGEDSVVLHWRKLGVLMVGPYGDWLRFPFENTENLFLIPEIDSCRVIADTSVDVLQRVPAATAALLRIGSIEPSAMLLDASDAFESGSPSSDEAARAIKKTGMLMEAVETCTEAATKEYDVAMQKRLLRAASYGMHFSYKDPLEGNVMGGPVKEIEGTVVDGETLPSETAIKFTFAARKLRILNALRDPTVGIILTSTQFDQITATGVIARLVAMKRPALASSISKYLGLPRSVQLYARAAKAAAFVTTDTSQSDAETAEAAIQMINEDGSNTGNTSNSGGFAAVALAANKAGRPGVANLLLMLESSVADKVPALIATGSYADAMAVATTARDAEFIFLTLMEFEKSCMANANDLVSGQNDFLGTVTTKFTPEGFHTLRRYLETLPDVKNVTNLLLRAHKYISAGSAMARKAMMSNTDLQERANFLSEATRIYGLGTKDTAFYKLCTDEYVDLLKDQKVLRDKYGVDAVAPTGASITATIVSVIRHAGENKRESHRLLGDADKIAKKFRVPDKRLWYIKVKAFADSNQWTQLRTLADSSRKPPIGFKPFAAAAIKGNQSIPEITRYIDRVVLPEERHDLFCEANLHKRALDEAVKMKDLRRIANVKSISSSAEIQEQCDAMFNRIASA